MERQLLPPCLDDSHQQGPARCAAYVKRELLQAEVPVADLVGGPFECCAVRIRLEGGGDTTVASVYIRPQQAWDPRCLRQLAHRLGREFLLCGDVNAHHPAWGGRRPDPRGREVRDVLQPGDPQHWGRHLRPPRAPSHQHGHRPQRGHGGLPAPRDREYRVVDWRIYRQLFQQDTGGRDLLQLVAENARAATVITKAQQGQPVPDMQHLALRAARRRAQRQALRTAQPELWTVFQRVDAVCRRHARGRRNQGWVSVCVSIDSSRDGTRAWRLLKCLLMVPRAINQVLSLAVHLTIQAADLTDQFAARDVAQLPAAPPPAALPCPASCHHPDWVAAQMQELCNEPIRIHELTRFAISGDSDYCAS
ncbi:hypothetical protein MTO96_034158 [Rhipicephalus appendiculatus]